MAETLQRFHESKSPKRVHFELRPIHSTNGTPKSMTTRQRQRIKASLNGSPPPNIPASRQFANKPLFANASTSFVANFLSFPYSYRSYKKSMIGRLKHYITKNIDNKSRDPSAPLTTHTTQPRKSAMKTMAMFPQQQQQSELVKSTPPKSKKSTKAGGDVDDELVRANKIITPSIFSAPQQQVETDEELDEQPIGVGRKSPPKLASKSSGNKKSSSSKSTTNDHQQLIDDQLKATAMITPAIFSAPPPAKEDPEPEEKRESSKSLNKKNSSNSTSPATKHKSPIREESVTEKDGITPELIKKVAALKPLIDNATSNTDLRSAGDESKLRKGDKATASKKSSNNDDKSSKSKGGSVKSTSSAKSNELVNDSDSATAQIVLGPMRSRDPVHNALNFSAIQREQKDVPVAPPTVIKKTVSKKH